MLAATFWLHHLKSDCARKKVRGKKKNYDTFYGISIVPDLHLVLSNIEICMSSFNSLSTSMRRGVTVEALNRWRNKVREVQQLAWSKTTEGSPVSIWSKSAERPCPYRWVSAAYKTSTTASERFYNMGWCVFCGNVSGVRQCKHESILPMGSSLLSGREHRGHQCTSEKMPRSKPAAQLTLLMGQKQLPDSCHTPNELKT